MTGVGLKPWNVVPGFLGKAYILEWGTRFEPELIVMLIHWNARGDLNLS